MSTREQGGGAVAVAAASLLSTLAFSSPRGGCVSFEGRSTRTRNQHTQQGLPSAKVVRNWRKRYTPQSNSSLPSWQLAWWLLVQEPSHDTPIQTL